MSKTTLQAYFPLAIQVSGRAKDDYELPVELLRNTRPSLQPMQLLVASLRRRQPAAAVSAGQLNLLALLNTVLRTVIEQYLAQRKTHVGPQSLTVEGQQSGPALGTTLDGFVELFPPSAVWAGVLPARFLRDETSPERCRQALTELFILLVQNANPAAKPFKGLFDDEYLQERTGYRQKMAAIDEHLGGMPVAGRLAGSLLKLLLAPIEAAPDSLEGQLGHIREHWKGLLPPELFNSILVAFDIIAEEHMQRGFGTGETPVPEFTGPAFAYDEPEAFTVDAGWMPNVVLIAKTIYVWLDQLTKKYGRPISKLDEIPDQELDSLADWGFTALWLIGIWERSSSSQKIKQIMGNPEAAASAYSLYDYQVAHDLGGEQALARLDERCQARGIRLGSDVVPNHTGLYSRWVKEHPDWYVQVDQPPYIGYSFTGPDLSPDPDLGLYIEDGYFNHSDAAVVFKHVDHRSGQQRFIYHGNDGTHMPWNDTAQLNYLLPQVREAMVQTILHIARHFKVIRFDAAMTLAKKHYQRLWYPQPGGGAGVPSRAEHWMSREDFERAFPVEFWRDVVDRVQQEVPDTLLLAEAFWLMEGYFVRTLGMHRVYNSAFMNMLKQEENAKYRNTIKNVVEFNPEILQRFVNFMNNPDEDTAVEQFGRADKYFGVAVLLATMPGLPMFGHGQIEGLKEKYGMEYRRAYWDESPDPAFIDHHRQQIFPLLRRRHLFSGAENFELYNFISGGHTNEDVFAYSNRCGHEQALVVYHNRHAETGGWVGSSVPKAASEGGGQSTSSLVAALGFSVEPDRYCRFRDHRSGLEYLRPLSKLAHEGLYLHLGPYQYHVFLDFQEIHDQDGLWGELYGEIGDQPVADLNWELRKLRYLPLIAAFTPLVEAETIKELGTCLLLPESQRDTNPVWLRFTGLLPHFIQQLGRFAQLPLPWDQMVQRIEQRLSALHSLARLNTPLSRRVHLALDGKAPDELRILLPFMLLGSLADPPKGAKASGRCAAWCEDLVLEHALKQALGGPQAEREALLVKLLIRHQEFWSPADQANFRFLLADPSVQFFTSVHWDQGTRWVNKESLELLLDWLEVISALSSDGGKKVEGIEKRTETALKLADKGGYKVDSWLEQVTEAERLIWGKSRRLKVLLVASEVTPFAKSGGLADVAGSLPRGLHELGHDVRIVMPYYQAVQERGEKLEPERCELSVTIAGHPRKVLVHEGRLGEVPVYFIDYPDYFRRDGLYGDSYGDFGDNAERFGLFCRAVLEALPRLEFRPDVLHLNDWQTGLLPVLLRTEYALDPFYGSTGTLMTIHNLGYQGLFDRSIIQTLQIDPRAFSMDGMEFHGGASLLKGGLMYSDKINTVSETYCREIQTQEMGIGFEDILRRRRSDLSGIVNGLDGGFWNPAKDPALAKPYSASRLADKAHSKTALQRELGLEENPDIPIVAMVTRLATQKGLDLVEKAWEGMMQRPLQFVLLGTGERWHTEVFSRLKDRYPGKASINLSFDDALSRRIYAGSDMFLMPSHYEPCGLGQLIALRYGCIPLVRRTGGLADTVTDPTEDAKNANGFSFSAASGAALLETLDRALSTFADRKAWAALVKRGMEQDFSWERSARRYLGIYQKTMERRGV